MYQWSGGLSALSKWNIVFWHCLSWLTSDKKGPHICLTQSELAGMHPWIQTRDSHIASLTMRLTFYQVISSIADKVYGATKLKTPYICIKTDFHTAIRQVGSWKISTNKSFGIQSADILLCLHGSKQSFIIPFTTTTCKFMVWTVCVAAKWTHSDILAIHRDMAVPRCPLPYSRSSEDVTVTDMTRNMSPISTCHQAADPSWEREMAQLPDGSLLPFKARFGSITTSGPLVALFSCRASP